MIVARNLLRWVAAGVAAHGARGREIMLALRAAGAGVLDMPISGVEKLKKQPLSWESPQKEGLSTDWQW